MSDPRAMTDVYQTAVVTVWDPERGDVGLDPACVAQQRGEQAVVLTAWNPGETRRSEAQNEQANRDMREVLMATGLHVWDADGKNPDGSYHEPGFCVWGMSEDLGLAVARQFDQFAIYVYRPTGTRQIAWADDGSLTPQAH